VTKNEFVNGAQKWKKKSPWPLGGESKKKHWDAQTAKNVGDRETTQSQKARKKNQNIPRRERITKFLGSRRKSGGRYRRGRKKKKKRAKSLRGK